VKFTLNQQEISKTIADFVHKRLGMKEPKDMKIYIKSAICNFRRTYYAEVTVDDDEYEK
jgi:hypothetical protein